MKQTPTAAARSGHTLEIERNTRKAVQRAPVECSAQPYFCANTCTRQVQAPRLRVGRMQTQIYFPSSGRSVIKYATRKAAR